MSGAGLEGGARQSLLLHHMVVPALRLNSWRGDRGEKARGAKAEKGGARQFVLLHYMDVPALNLHQVEARRGLWCGLPSCTDPFLDLLLLLPDYNLPRYARCNHPGNFWFRACRRPGSLVAGRNDNVPSRVMLQREVLLGQILLRLRGCVGDLLLVQLLVVSPQRARPGGSPCSALTVEVGVIVDWLLT